MRSDSLINCTSLNASICPVRAVWCGSGEPLKTHQWGGGSFPGGCRGPPHKAHTGWPTKYWSRWAFMLQGGRKGGEVRLVGYGEFSGSVWPWKTCRPGSSIGPGGVVKGPEWGSAARGVELRCPVGGGTLVWDQGALRRSRVQATGPSVWGPPTFGFVFFFKCFA